MAPPRGVEQLRISALHPIDVAGTSFGSRHGKNRQDSGGKDGFSPATIRRRLNGNHTGGGDALLYFAYNARIAPDQMAATAPGADFRFIAHLPEWGLVFPISDGSWGGALPVIAPEPGSTVWGAVYELDKKDYAALDAVEAAEQRNSETVEAMDRTGKRHQVVVHLLDGAASPNGNGPLSPSAKYLALMVAGSRHWELPAGWIAGLEEHLENGA